MIDINTSLIFQIVNFLLMIIVLNYLLYRPIRGVLKERREKIDGFESDIERMIQKANDRGADIESRLAEAKREGFNKKEEAKGQGLEEEKLVIDEANNQAEEALKKVKAQISEEIVVAREALKKDLEIFSADLARKILGRSFS
ncbi:MAG: ATP synthase F0 subunit B [Deltaproteobacteria bacterium]|nr:ATP synthase F0 subunit B [Deltaproteobacteria bacterium]MBW2052011.1 ATP synthase F0 subunit B [Deltaproteobacteria bacterium]MBW2139959.1 ATP synthase F0 subunit B [Deltaproteobacteria bacterium]MBW2322192.1 ATP synthase F0 subunit B [Deltaproteobacteria bacterium]